MMKIAIVGSGGREHVIASCIRKNQPETAL